MMQSARASDAGAPRNGAAALMHFNLPAQPLAAALRSYIDQTDLSVLAQSSMIAQRTSAPVQGDYSTREALQRLLAGTGLTVRFLGDTAAAIVALPQTEQAAVPTPSEVIPPSEIAGIMADGADYRPYVALVQQQLGESLCESPQTRPGNYRLLVQLNVTRSGAVEGARLLDSTGDVARDTAIARTLHGLVFDLPPPAAMPQPITILFRPEGNGIAADCPLLDEGR